MFTIHCIIFVVVFITLKCTFFYTKNIYYSSNVFRSHNFKLNQTVILVVCCEDLLHFTAIQQETECNMNSQSSCGDEVYVACPIR